MINKSRVTFIEELETFISNKQKELNSVLDTLGWTEESLKDDVRHISLVFLLILILKYFLTLNTY